MIAVLPLAIEVGGDGQGNRLRLWLLATLLYAPPNAARRNYATEPLSSGMSSCAVARRVQGADNLRVFLPLLVDLSLPFASDGQGVAAAAATVGTAELHGCSSFPPSWQESCGAGRGYY